MVIIKQGSGSISRVFYGFLLPDFLIYGMVELFNEKNHHYYNDYP